MADYELYTKDEVTDLKKEMATLKKHAGYDSSDLAEVRDAINKLIYIFKETNVALEVEEVKEKERIQAAVKPLEEKVERVLEQQSQIAEAIIALSDMLDEMKKPSMPSSSDLFNASSAQPRATTAPPMPPSSSMPAQDRVTTNPQVGNLPPLPDQHKKHGLFKL